MPLLPGSRIGPYEVKDKLGEGGMGEVYRAHDAKLGRDVALKILSAAFAGDPERIARFDREARTLASLNQPLIAQIYGFEQADGVSALVMELVEGEDLAVRLKRGAMPQDEAIPIARQIAEALEAAHEAGIVHRDLKPANVKVRPDGTVKVLDFGLAKALDPAAASGAQAVAQVTQSPTITTPAMTMRGVILGTAAYMAPEQAKGRAVTKRADLWALGCVMFEMLSGQRPFDGDDMTEVLASVIKTDPDWSLLPADLPPAIGALVRGCLQKDPRKRVADAAVVRYALDHLTAAAPVARATQPRSWRAMAAGVAAIAVLIATAVGATLALNQPARPSYRFAVVTGEDQAFWGSASARDLAITPDGRHLVYRARINNVPKLVVRDLNQTEGRVLESTDQARTPFISPDGQWVGYFANGALMKVALTGGAPVTICAVTGGPRGATWRGDRIVFATTAIATGLMAVSAAGGEPTELTHPDGAAGEADHVFPSLTPDGSHVLFTAVTGGGERTLKSLNIAAGEQKTIAAGGSDAQYLSPGVLVFAVGNTLRAARFDVSKMALTSEPVPVLERLSVTNPGGANFAVSDDGLLVHVPGTEAVLTRRSLVWVGADGREDPIKTDGRAFTDPRLGPDERQAVVEITDANDDVWTLDVARGAVTRQSFVDGEDETPAWMPDGRSIVYSSTRQDVGRAIYRRRADGVGAEEPLWTGTAHVHVEAVTPDGMSLIVSSAEVGGGPMDLMRLPLTGDRKMQPLTATPFSEFGARLSPDGRAIAYTSNESGRAEIYVRAFPSLENKTQVSASGGTEPVWSRQGGELYFIANESMMAVPLSTNGLTVGAPRRLFENRYYLKGTAHTSYDVARDGRFLMVKEIATDGGAAGPTHLRVALNWFEELATKVR